jgi:hypothetical protein
MTLNSKGALIIVTGHYYTAAAVEAAESVRRTNPTLQLGIFTDQDIINPLFEFVGRIDGDGVRHKHEFLLGKSPLALEALVPDFQTAAVRLGFERWTER